MTLSETLRKAVIASKKTRYAVAVGSGVDHAVLRRFMRKERDIKLSTAEHLADFLGLEFRKRRTSSTKKKA
jgi:transcriptional regulator with XRE-family HTH domain